MNLTNICFSLPSLIFVLILIGIYLLKKKLTSIGDYVFFALMCIISVICVMEMALPYSIEHYGKYTDIICKIFLILNACWQFLFVVYADVIVYKGDKFTKDKWLRIPGHLVSLILALVFIILYLVTDIEYTTIDYNNFYTMTGTISYYMYANIILANLCVLGFLNMNRERIKNIHLGPIVVILISYILVIIRQIACNIEINEISFFGSLLVAVIYFTIESYDYKLVDEYSRNDEELEEKAKTAFLINMSHEIRTPLNTIIGFAQIINEEENINEEYLKKDLKNIIEASESLSSLINNIIEISNIETEGTTLLENNYLLETLIFEINGYIPQKITNDELKFTIDINQQIPKEYNGDSYKVYKLLTYILLNAIDNTTYGEVKLEITGQKLENGYFEQQYIIANSGHSMKYENFHKDFEAFVDLQKSGDGKLDSIKLGLLIAKELIKALGGTIEFINEKGQGTKYIIKIKQKIINETQIGNLFENITNGLATTRNLLDLSDKTAMVVDDGEVNLKMAKKSLSQYSINVVLVKSGKECIETVKKQKIDVIFMDHMMPEMDGIATLKALKATFDDVPPIVALTANNYDALKNEYIAQGFYDYLHKPIVFKELNRVMKRIFAPEEDE